VTALALLAHGAGSCPETAVRLLGPAVPAGVDVRAVDSRGTVDEVVAELARAAAGHEVALVGGISLGAHAAALWASRGGATVELVLAMPAWTGPPDEVAALTAASADDVGTIGVARLLARISSVADPDDWVLDELRRGWTRYDDDLLARTLRSAATSPGPTVRELGRIGARTVVVALDDDPLHPLEVARRWSAAIPGAGLAVVARDAPRTDRGALGRAARRLLDPDI
jgi:pimeloyl-ACP methyl ester carboxylesterase